MQDRAICFQCTGEIEHSPVFEAPCGHEHCPSMVFHALCLMAWREHRDAVLRSL